MKVKLLVDLTKYDPLLVQGIIGTAYEDKISYTDWEEQMVDCKFPGVAVLPISWKGLEILDKQYWRNRERDIKQAVKIEHVVGPRGGFKWLRIYSVSKNGVERTFTTNVKHEAEKLLQLAKNLNKEILLLVKQNR